MPHTQAYHRDKARTLQADFRITYHGTITTITPLSDRCREWLEDNVAIEPWQRFGASIAIEPRYVQQLAEAMIGEGLVMEGEDVVEEGRPSRRGERGWGLVVIVIALLSVLAGCGPDRRAAYQSQLQADHQACLNGTTPSACIAYQLDVQKCSPVIGNPVAAGCY